MELQFANIWKIEIASVEQDIITKRKILSSMLAVIKTFLGLLSIKNGCLYSFYHLVHFDSIVLSLIVGIGLLRKQYINKKRSVLIKKKKTK